MNNKRRIVGFAGQENDKASEHYDRWREKLNEVSWDTFGVSYRTFEKFCEQLFKFFLGLVRLSGIIAVVRLAKALTKWLNRH